MPKGNHGKPKNLPATLTVSPNPAIASSDFAVGGCGYTPGAGVQLNLYAPGSTSVQAINAGADGCLSGFIWAPATPGTANLEALEGSTTVVARLSFQIVAGGNADA